ncbi:hypothetical protein B0J11DRAFT_127385 [Dendryphion nanum]|uniref:Uncharacterized protein n=1 Tax=Dendryphion nanum TaxID=256645 RepID=A0A9P9ICZ5_9PLEO|nr:hypothetical protein B0J11DRAFT_127385 [Dendryphion nanum]
MISSEIEQKTREKELYIARPETVQYSVAGHRCSAVQSGSCRLCACVEHAGGGHQLRELHLFHLFNVCPILPPCAAGSHQLSCSVEIGEAFRVLCMPCDLLEIPLTWVLAVICSWDCKPSGCWLVPVFIVIAMGHGHGMDTQYGHVCIVRGCDIVTLVWLRIFAEGRRIDSVNISCLVTAPSLLSLYLVVVAARRLFSLLLVPSRFQSILLP